MRREASLSLWTDHPPGLLANRFGKARASPGCQQLSMGFDFGKMMEKAGDSRYARCRHILIEEKGPEAQARLGALKADIDGDVDKFSEVATEISTCTSAVRKRQTGGD